MKKSIIYIVYAIIVILLLIYSIAIKYVGINDEIIIYTCMEEYRNKKLEEMINQEFPNKKIRIQYISTGNLAAKIKTEKKNIEADIIMGLEKAYAEEVKDNFMNLKNYVDTSNYIDGINPEHNKYLTWIKFSSAIIVNEKVIKDKGLDIPKSYEDLLKPEYKELIAMPDPKSSGTGYMILKNILNIYGEEKGFEFFDKLEKNIKEFTASGMGPVRLLKQNEIAIGIGMTNQAVNEINKNVPLKIIIPEQGAPYNTTAIAIIKGKENKKNIKEIFEWIVNEYGVYDKTYFMPEQVLINQDSKVENYPININYGDMTGIEDSNIKEVLLKKWKY